MTIRFHARLLAGALLTVCALAAHVALAADGADRAPAPAAALAAGGHASLEGIWMFDAAHSDDPMKIMQASRPQGMAGRGGPGGGGMGGGMGGGGLGGGPRGGGFGQREAPGENGEGPVDTSDPEGRAQMRQRQAGQQAMGRVMRPAKKVVIALLADEVTVAEDEREARPYALADSLSAHGRDLVTEYTKAKWKGGKLEMSQELGRRGTLVETYELSPDGRTLTIRARREGGPEGMPNPTFTRVYTRYDGE